MVQHPRFARGPVRETEDRQRAAPPEPHRRATVVPAPPRAGPRRRRAGPGRGSERGRPLPTAGYASAAMPRAKSRGPPPWRGSPQGRRPPLPASLAAELRRRPARPAAGRPRRSRQPRWNSPGTWAGSPTTSSSGFPCSAPLLLTLYDRTPPRPAWRVPTGACEDEPRRDGKGGSGWMRGCVRRAVAKCLSPRTRPRLRRCADTHARPGTHRRACAGNCPAGSVNGGALPKTGSGTGNGKTNRTADSSTAPIRSAAESLKPMPGKAPHRAEPARPASPGRPYRCTGPSLHFVTVRCCRPCSLRFSYSSSGHWRSCPSAERKARSRRRRPQGVRPPPRRARFATHSRCPASKAAHGARPGM